MSSASSKPPAQGGEWDPKDGSFTLDGYRTFLQRTLQQYELADFAILGASDLASRSVCLLRHDIDISPPRALRLARIEAEFGIRTTYTVLMTGRFYNPMERDVRDMLIEIAALGHNIGLHFDADWHGVEDEDTLETALRREINNLGNVLKGVPIEMFSFHDPSERALSFQALQYGGLWNAYSAVQREHFSYLSDSNGYWRFRTWQEALDEHPPRLHILTHPEWWVERIAPPAERISTAIDERSLYMWQKYCAGLVATERENKSSIPEALELLPKLLGGRGDQLARQWLSGDRAGALVNVMIEVRRSAAAAGAGDEQGEAASRRILEDLWSGSIDPDGESLQLAFTDAVMLLARSLPTVS